MAPSDQSDEIQALLQRHGTSQSAAVGMVLDELANLMSDTVPRLQEVSENLRTADQQVCIYKVKWAHLVFIVYISL